MSIDREKLEAQLAESEDALHRLMTGGQVTKVDYEGHGTEFARPTEQGLRRRINELKRKLGVSRGGGSRRAVF
ncbi:gpW family head-tail joining protein [Tritonibacter mobilis]|uniref:gpW family head-tail joining protein n=1 Tax=Tritonibacter mobilis TaxID=379347 RepID=UPI000806BF59|nr:gpW family head-tail joining protein [Tritonibacter mobilis]